LHEEEEKDKAKEQENWKAKYEQQVEITQKLEKRIAELETYVKTFQAQGIAPPPIPEVTDTSSNRLNKLTDSTAAVGMDTPPPLALLTPPPALSFDPK